jgi:hypothetical protein
MLGILAYQHPKQREPHATAQLARTRSRSPRAACQRQSTAEDPPSIPGALDSPSSS